jgi:hypothetical protein
MVDRTKKRANHPSTQSGKAGKPGGGQPGNQRGDKNDAGHGMGKGSHAEMERRERDEHERDRSEKADSAERGES